MKRKSKDVYIVISTCAHVYAFLWIILMLIALGDDRPTFYLPQAFSWSILWIIWHVCDQNPHTFRAAYRRYSKVRALVRQISSMALVVQSVAYFAWTIYEWSIAKDATSGDSFIKMPAVFYGLLVATTAAMAITSSITFFIVSYYHDYQ